MKRVIIISGLLAISLFARTTITVEIDGEKTVKEFNEEQNIFILEDKIEKLEIKGFKAEEEKKETIKSLLFW